MSILLPPSQFRHPDQAILPDGRADRLNFRFKHNSAINVMRYALTEMGRIALVSSFGAESVVLLHMASLIDRDTPITMIDTEMLFDETLSYQQDVSAKLGLTGVLVVRGGGNLTSDPDGTLHLRDTDACCALRKTRPLQTALKGFDGWITGRKRFQSNGRAALEFFETETGTGRIKVNPLAHWRPEDIKTYMDENALPRHPLVARGYPSIGCAPCTAPVADGDDPRAGRWQGEDKTECGIHFVDGKPVRAGA